MPTLADIQKLRKATHAGISACREALLHSKGDFQEAIAFLRKKGIKAAGKRADRQAHEGSVFAEVSEKQDFGVILALGCETDFVSRNDAFKELGKRLIALALKHQCTTAAALLELTEGASTLAEQIQLASGTMGEKIELVGYETLKGKTVGCYVHTGHWLGALAALEHPPTPAISQAAKDIAVQVVVSNPLAINGDDLDPKLLEQERKRIQGATQVLDKPAHILAKIVESQEKKFIQEQTLIHQPFVKDGSKNVAAYLQSLAGEVTISGFQRLQIARP